MKHFTLFLLAACVGLMMHAQLPSYVPTDGLVAWYDMDGNLSDSSPHGHDGTATNLAPAMDRYGVDGGCLSFSGSVVPNTNRTQIANDAFGELPISDAFEDGMTISIWALEAPTSDSEFLQRRSNNSIDFTLGRNDDGGIATHMGFEAFAGPGETGLDNWHHYALTYDEETIKLYIDGVLSNSRSANQNVNGFANWVGLGKYTYYGGLTHFFFFNGLMDELGFWNRALTENEVLQLNEDEAPPFGCTDETACNYIPQGLTASQYTDSLGYSVATLISSGYEPANLIGMEYGGGLIYNIEEQEADLVISIVHPPEYADAPVPNMGLNPGSACGAGGQFGGSFLNAPEQCANLVLEGYDDWFLPTIEQVQQVYETLFYSAEFPINVCATGASGYFKGVDYLSATETCRCYFGTGEVLCNAPAGNAYEYFPVRQTLIPALPPNVECEFGCEYCGPGTSWDAIAQMCVVATSPYLNDPGEAAVINPCYFDSDQSGIVDVTDLMNVLSVYGLACGEIPEAAEFSCGESLDYFGYEYATVQIGQQCWFAENLRVESYSNGESIPNGLDDVDWYTTSQGAMTAYGEGASTCNNYVLALGDACDETVSIPEYGRLYNWHAVADERGLCPSGWHVPSDLEWMTLELQLGMASSEVNGTGWRGTDQGSQLKNEDGWFQNGAGSNSSGFSGLPAGDRTNSIFVNAGTYGTFWSSTETGGSTAWDRFIGYDDQRVYRTSFTKQSGFSVRCLQNTNNNE